MKQYRLEAMFDHDSERPDECSLGRMVSFSNRHNNFTHPEVYHEMDCPDCNGYGTPDSVNATECGKCEGSGVVGCAINEHPDVLATLSYYEHGLCRWMVGRSTVSDPGGFDTAQVAGVIVWNGEDNERKWWDELGDDRRREILDGIAEEYTSWANGDCFGYQLTKNAECPTCHDISHEEEVDSCWGYIGSEWFGEAVSDMIHGLQIDPADVDVVGEAGDYFTIRAEA